MSLKGKSSKGTSFINYILSGGRVWKLALLTAVALVLLLLGSVGGTAVVETEQSEEEKTEQRLVQICSSLEGVGKCKVMVCMEKVSTGYGSKSEARVVSVTVLCKGASRESVRKNLTDLITSMYGIGANRIMIGKLT